MTLILDGPSDLRLGMRLTTGRMLSISAVWIFGEPRIVGGDRCNGGGVRDDVGEEDVTETGESQRVDLGEEWEVEGVEA
jgi:hypothetical protein